MATEWSTRFEEQKVELDKLKKANDDLLDEMKAQKLKVGSTIVYYYKI